MIYIPDKGDVVWINFDPQTGREIKKTRPALVISPKEYNAKTNLAIFMPITSTIKNYPFEVRVKIENKDGVILCDQVRSLDWNKRGSSLITNIRDDLFNEVIAKFRLLLNSK